MLQIGLPVVMQSQPSFRIECWQTLKCRKFLIHALLLNPQPESPKSPLVDRVPPLFCTVSDDLQLQLQNLIGFNWEAAISSSQDPSRLLRPPDGQPQICNFEQQLRSLNFEERFDDSLTSQLDFEQHGSLNFKQQLGSSAISNSGWIAPDKQHQAYEQRLAPDR